MCESIGESEGGLKSELKHDWAYKDSYYGLNHWSEEAYRTLKVGTK